VRKLQEQYAYKQHFQQLRLKLEEQRNTECGDSEASGEE
jgi:hypothetical protein